MNNVKIVRLINGCDIISTVEVIIKDKFLLSDPMVFELQYKGSTSHIVMQHFLHTQLNEKNEVIIDAKDILCITTPKSDFAEYYENSVEKNKEMELKENSFQDHMQMDLNEQIKEILVQSFNQMEPGNPEERTIH